MSALTRPSNVARPRATSRGRSLPEARGDPQLRLRVTRREELDMERLVEWVLNMTQARYDAHRAGEPDPYDLPLPEELTGCSGVGSQRARRMGSELVEERRTA